jgi:ParB-like chromosome segregation protein Spo0J
VESRLPNPLPTLYLRPGDIIADSARNLSRAGLAHDPALVREMADMLLEHGQLSPVEVDAPEGWSAADWAQCVSEHGIGLVTCGEFVDLDAQPGRLVYGFRRFAAAQLLEREGKTSPRWDGRLQVVCAPDGLTAQDLEDRNLAENLGREGVAFVDLGAAAHYLTADPKDGGRGEEHRIAATRLGVTRPDLKRLLILGGLCEEWRALSRLNHRDPERGINDNQALKLARRPIEEQHKILAESRDMGGNITPKAVRAAIAPHQGRQGQPPGATGAQLTRASQRLDLLLSREHEQQRWGVTPTEATLARDILLAIASLDPAALAKLPGRLGKLIETEFTREVER